MILYPQLQEEYMKAKSALEAAQRVCIISHRRPDADAVGANLALRYSLERMGKQVTSACVDKPPKDSYFLPKVETFVKDFNYEDFDVIMSVDCGDIKLVKFHEEKPEILTGNKPFINVDHHFSNDGFGSINLVNPEACSTCIIIYDFLHFAGWYIDRHMATALLHGIYFDTGGLMHSNTSKEVFETCSDLTALGADLQRVSKELFHTTPVNRLRLWGRILERAYVNEEGVVVSAVNKEDYEATGAGSGDTGGAIDFLNAVPEAKYSVLLSEGKDGLVKGSLRTQREDVNLSEIAAQWGGGGHAKASGFGLKGTLKPSISWKIDPEDKEGGNMEEIKF